MSWLAAPLNRLLDDASPRPGYRIDRAARRAALARAGRAIPNDVCVLLAFSGGGTRAAALSLGVLEALRDESAPLPLLDAVDVVSSVSGGSFTAGYFALFGARVFDDFRRNFLYAPIQLQLIGKLLAPWNWSRLASPYFDRIDLAAEHYERLFERATFAHLPATAPYIAVNATDMATGTRFPFTQPHFDLIGSDLSSFSIARAVAASSAFPFLLSPLTVRNFGARPDFDWSPFELSPADAELNFEQFQAARAALTYRAAEDKRWIHLLDGGLADNVGAHHVVDLLQGGEILRELGSGTIRKLVCIIVDAKTTPRSRIGRRRRAPGVLGMAVATGTIPLNNFSDDSAMLAERVLRSLQSAAIGRWEAAQQKVWPRSGQFAIRFPAFSTAAVVSAYVVHVTLAAIPDEAERDRAMRIRTNFWLSRNDVEFLSARGRELLGASRAWAEFLAELRGSAGGAVASGSGAEPLRSADGLP